MTDNSFPKIIVKFKDDIKLPEYSDEIEKKIKSENFKSKWDLLKNDFPELKLKRKFDTDDVFKINSIANEIKSKNDSLEAHSLLSFFEAESDNTVSRTDKEKLVKSLLSTGLFETVYLDEGPADPPSGNPSDNPYFYSQKYLNPAPEGIDAIYSWNINGGDGANVGFVDMERGWTLNHEDLISSGITIISGDNMDFFGHGTSVLGEVVAINNNIGCIGIAYKVFTRVVSQWQYNGYNTDKAIGDAIYAMSPGDVLLIEAQTKYNSQDNLPVEVYQSTFEKIKSGTQKGIIVIEAAGNGGHNLNDFRDTSYGQRFNRSSSNFKDSGAIMVSAASSGYSHSRLNFSNYGNRIDCYAWGENIYSAGDGWEGNETDSYTSGFGGTSGASPIIAGAALCIQGINKAKYGRVLMPSEMRKILSDFSNGTRSANPSTDMIGVMPDLKKIIKNVFGMKLELMSKDTKNDEQIN